MVILRYLKLTLGLLTNAGPDEAAIKTPALPHMDAEVFEPAAPTSSIKTVDLTDSDPEAATHPLGGDLASPGSRFPWCAGRREPDVLIVKNIRSTQK